MRVARFRPAISFGRAPVAIALGLALAVLLPLSTAAAEVFGQSASGLPELSAADVKALQGHLEAEQAKLAAKLGGDAKALQSAKQAPLGPVRRRGALSGRVVTVPAGRWLSEVSDVSTIKGFAKSEAFQAGAVWQAWTSSAADINHSGGRRPPWRGVQDVPQDFELRKLPSDWRGLFNSTSRQGLADGYTRGHNVPFKEVAGKVSFQVYGNALPQSLDSNAGAWRDFEKAVQNVSAEHHIIQYSGVLWEPYHYKKLDGSEGVVKPELFKGGIPKPTAHWKVVVMVPKRDERGRPLTLAEGLLRSRPAAVVVPNAQDPEVFVSPWTRFSTTAQKVQELTQANLFSFLDGAPGSNRIRRALLSHHDRGSGIPHETDMPKWKIAQLKRIYFSKPDMVSEHARKLAGAMLGASGNGRRTAAMRRGVAAMKVKASEQRSNPRAAQRRAARSSSAKQRHQQRQPRRKGGQRARR